MRSLRRLALDERTILAGVMAGAVAVRVAAAQRSFWFDETITALKASVPVGALLDGLTRDVHPPLYYLLAHAWAGVAGTSELGLRSLSIVWSVVAVGAVWAWSREALPHAPALVPAGLVAFGPFGVWYGSEARPYAQLLALTALGGWLAWRVMGARPRACTVAALALALAAAAYTHYIGALFVLSVGMVALVLACSRRQSRAGALAVLAACAAAALALAPWVAWIATQGAPPATTVYPRPDLFAALIVAIEMAVGFHPHAALGVAAAAWPLLCLLALALVPDVGAVRWRVGGLLVVAALPAALLVLVSLLGPRSVFDPRFLIVCAAPLYLAAGALWQRLLPRRALAWLAVPLACAGVVVGLRQSSDASNPKLYDLRAAVGAANRLAAPGDALLLVPQLETALDGRRSIDPVTAYYRPSSALRRVDTAGATPERVLERMRHARPRRALVLYGFERAGAGRAGRALAAAYRRDLAPRSRAERTLRFANVTLEVRTLDWDARR